MNIFFDRFAASQVTAAAGITNPALQSWLRRGHVIGHPEADTSNIEGGGSAGIHRRFSFHTVMQLAIAKALTDCSGMGAKEALYAGGYFAHTGSEARTPAVPFNGGGSFLGVALHPDEEYPAVTVASWKPGIDLYPNLSHRLRTRNFVMVFLNPIFDAAVTSLGYRPEDVLDRAYGTDRHQRPTAAGEVD